MSDIIRVLYVDDNPHDRDLVRDALEKEHGGFLLTEASSRETFEAELARGSWDIVLSDFNILGYQGLEVIETVKNSRPGVPVVIVTGTGSEEYAVQAMKLGAADYVIKTPSHILHLPTTLHSVIKEREAEKRIRDHQDFARGLIAAMPDGLSVLDAEGVHVEVNAALCEMTGFSREELIGTGLPHPYWPPEHRGQIQEMFLQMRDIGPISLEVIFCRKNGEAFPVLISPAVMKGPDGRPTHYFAIIKDITILKRNEESLQQSEERLRRTARAGNVGLWDWDLRTNEVWYSQEWKRQIGYEDHEISNAFSEWESRVHPEDLEATVQKVRAFVDNPWPDYSIEFRFRHKDGSYRWILSEASLEHDAQGKAVRMFGSQVDITRRKLMEDELREREAFLAALLDAIPLPVYYKDADGRYLEFNAAFAGFLGRTTEQLRGKTASDVSPERLAEVYRAKDKELVAQGGHQVYEAQAKNGRGEFRDVVFHKAVFYDAEGNVRGIIGAILDITERSQAEREVEEKAAFLNTVMEYSPFAMWIADPAGVAHRTNRALREALALPEEAIAGRYCVLEDENLTEQGVMPEVKAVFEEGRAARFVIPWKSAKEKQLQFAKDVDLWIDVSMFPILDAGGCLLHVVCQWVDISALKHEEAARRKIEAQLWQSRKMEAFGHLAGGIAHDFNNMLQAILIHLDFLETDVPEMKTRASDLTALHTGLDHAIHFIKQLLTFARQREVAFLPFDLGASLLETVNMIKRTIGEDIKVSYTPAPGTLIIHGEPSLIGEVIVNLCLNARDAMPEGGQLDIRVDQAEFDAAYCTKNVWAKEGRFLAITVTDTGKGMDQATRERIFEPFFTTKDPEKGTGLGLSVSYGIIEQHGGFIRVESAVGQGTRFSVYLPWGSGGHVAGGVVTEDSIPRGTETILLAEDDEIVSNLTRLVLENSGYQVVTARNGEEAVEAFRTHAGEVSMLLFDVVMPEMGGVDAYRQICAISPGIPVLFTSGHMSRGSHSRYVLPENAPFLPKPSGVTEILRKVREVLDRARGDSEQHNEPGGC